VRNYCHRQADFILLPRFTPNSKRRRRSQIPAQGWSVRQPWGNTDNNPSTLKAFAKDRAFANTFSVEELYFLLTQGCSNPGLKFANSVGVLLQESRCIVEPPQSQAQSSSLCGTPINVEVVTLPVYVVAVERPAPTYL
jgi:hypothetical protein